MATRWETIAGKAVIDGRTLSEWVPVLVRALVERFDPVRVILFGSVARGEDGPDSDIDLMVVLPHVDYSQRHELMAQMRQVFEPSVPIELFPTDERECVRRRDVIGSLHYWPLREGKVVYERAS
jgi:predicted nucleotidyltransferase